MNCSQIEKLLPLYASHDLPERREQTVTAHLESCEACSLAAAEYRDVQGLMRDFAPPVFGDEVYAQVRKNVWDRIEKQSQRRSVLVSISVWFQPGFAWAAAALMIVGSFVGLYLVFKDFNAHRPFIADIPSIVLPEIGQLPETHSGFESAPGEGSRNQRQANVPIRKRRSDRTASQESGNSVVASLPDEVITAPPVAPVIRTNNLDSAAGAERPLRMEIQTSNPNIRIIWFSQREPKPRTTPSKGI